MPAAAEWYCGQCGYKGPYVLGLSGIVTSDRFCPHCLELWLRRNVGLLQLVSVTEPRPEPPPAAILPP